MILRVGKTALNIIKIAKIPLLFGVVGLSILFVEGCAGKKGETVSKECVQNADQSNTFKGHWTAHPIPLGVIAVDFNAGELSAIEAGIGTWNTFFSASKGFQLFLNGSSSVAVQASGGSRVTSATACSQTVIGPSGFTKSIMIYKTSSGWTFGSSVIALTSLCPVNTTNSTYRMFVSAVMEVNYVNFFTNGQIQPDLQSVITHELGHLLGLDHSCIGSACSSAPPEYQDAVMYPALGFSGIYGQVKRDLQTNDEERANCLY